MDQGSFLFCCCCCFWVALILFSHRTICSEDKNTRRWVGRLPALIARGHKFNPSTTVSNTRSGGTPVIATLGSRDKNFLGLHWIGFVPFHIPAIAFVWVNLWNLCSTHLMSVALVNATLFSTQQTAEARWWGLHVCSFQKNFSLVMESCWGINTHWWCSHEKVFHAPIQSTHKSRLSELIF